MDRYSLCGLATPWQTSLLNPLDDSWNEPFVREEVVDRHLRQELDRNEPLKIRVLGVGLRYPARNLVFETAVLIVS